MSNNDAERELRAVALGPKNWTFAGSDEAAQLPSNADRNRQAQRCRPAGLARRRARSATRSSGQAHPPAPALRPQRIAAEAA